LQPEKDIGENQLETVRKGEKAPLTVQHNFLLITFFAFFAFFQCTWDQHRTPTEETGYP
jgi:hypothetical protein